METAENKAEKPSEISNVWCELKRGVTERRHGFHTFTLATIGADNLPEARTMVLRGVDSEAKTLTFNCDLRSQKAVQLRQRPHVAALFYSAKDKLQVRIRGTVTLHYQDEVSASVWEKMLAMSRECYRTPHAPGTVLSNTTDEYPLLSLDDAQENFCVCQLQIVSLEWLYLGYGGHTRFIHHFSNGTESVSRLAP